MQPKLEPIVCKFCSGKGITPSGGVCDKCRGVGATATDGVYEYYLGDDGKGGITVVDVKRQIGKQHPMQGSVPQKPVSSNSQMKNERKSVLKGLIFVMLIIIYSVIAVANFFFIKNVKIYWIATVIIGGFLILFFIYNSKIIRKVVNKLFDELLGQPDDFIKFYKTKKERLEREKS